MTVWAVLLSFVGAVNPLRRRRCLVVADPRQVPLGAAAALVVYVAFALVGATVRDALDVSTPNMRIAAALVLVVVGVHAVVAPLPAPHESVDDRTAWLVPVLFPVLLRPDLALVALAADRASGVLVVIASAVVALAAVLAWWSTAPTPLRASSVGWERGLGAVLGVATVVAAVRLLLDGVFAL
jgi:small neutral amino acid transporter SnatA (MarC family)